MEGNKTFQKWSKFSTKKSISTGVNWLFSKNWLRMRSTHPKDKQIMRRYKFSPLNMNLSHWNDFCFQFRSLPTWRPLPITPSTHQWSWSLPSPSRMSPLSSWPRSTPLSKCLYWTEASSTWPTSGKEKSDQYLKIEVYFEPLTIPVPAPCKLSTRFRPSGPRLRPTWWWDWSSMSEFSSRRLPMSATTLKWPSSGLPMAL